MGAPSVGFMPRFEDSAIYVALQHDVSRNGSVTHISQGVSNIQVGYR